MKRLFIFFFLVPLFSWSQIDSATVNQVRDEIILLRSDSVKHATTIAEAQELLKDATGALKYRYRLLKKLLTPPPAGGSIRIAFSLPENYPIAQGVQYLSNYQASDPARLKIAEYNKLKPVVIARWNEDIGHIAPIYATASDLDRAFDFETIGKQAYSIYYITKDPYKTKQKIAHPYEYRPDPDRDSIELYIPLPKYEAIEGRSLMVMCYVYFNDDFSGYTYRLYYTGSPADRLKQITTGERKPYAPKYDGYITNKKEAERYLKRLERRGLDDTEVRKYFGL